MAKVRITNPTALGFNTVRDGVDVDSEAPVVLPAATRAALIALGWIPPERRAVGDVALDNQQVAFG